MAIKKIDCSLKDLTHFKYVIREISILRQLSNSSAQTHLFDVILPKEYEDDLSKIRKIFLILEYLPKDLCSWINENDEIDMQTIIKLFYNCLTAINYIHSAGVMHRDIKPANILVADDLSVKICDFGLSRVS